MSSGELQKGQGPVSQGFTKSLKKAGGKGKVKKSKASNISNSKNRRMKSQDQNIKKMNALGLSGVGVGQQKGDLEEEKEGEDVQGSGSRADTSGMNNLASGLAKDQQESKLSNLLENQS